MNDDAAQNPSAASAPDSSGTSLLRMGPKSHGPGTFASHAGCDGHPPVGPTHAHTPPIMMSINFGADDLAMAKTAGQLDQPGYCYARLAEPTGEVLTKFLADLEGGEDAIVFGSGMAAVSTAILAYIGAGEHMLVSNSLYSGSRGFIDKVLPRYGVETTYFDATKPPEELDALVRPETRLVFLEPLTNPLVEVTDVPAYVTWARSKGLKTLADNTLTPPPIFRPLENGVDLAIHSLTKYINGHGDVMAGAVIGAREEIARVRPLAIAMGGCLPPLGSYLVIRGARSLDVRLRRASDNAFELAKFLEAHPKVARVHYPGLPSSDQHALCLRLFGTDRPGGVLSFVHADGETGADRFIKKCKFISFAASLGEPQTLVEYPPVNQYGHLSREEKCANGIIDGLMRLAVGIEDIEDLIAEVDGALKD